EGAPETIPASLVAGLAMSIGDKERALSELERGVALGDPSVPFAHIEPIYDPLRAEPRFRQIIRTIGLE
ncbi:MAG: hypothetical protein AAF657_41725, partial [Acidobacteriota bacterium]